jgi:hypothetical protein
MTELSEDNEKYNFDTLFFGKPESISNIYEDNELSHFSFINMNDDTSGLCLAVELDSIPPFNHFYFCYSILNPNTSKYEKIIDYSYKAVANLNFLNNCGIHVYKSQQQSKPLFALNIYDSSINGAWMLEHKNSYTGVFEQIKIDSNLLIIESDTIPFRKELHNLLSLKNDSLLMSIISYSRKKLIIKLPNNSDYIYYNKVAPAPSKETN